MDVMKILHKFVSAKVDGSDSTLVKPTDWNNDHDMSTDGDGVVLGRPTGAGPGPVQEIPFQLLTIVDEVVLTVPAVELRVDIPVNAKFIQLSFLTLNMGNINDTLKMNGLNGSTVMAPASHQTQYLVGSGAVASGGFANADNGWRLGDLIVASQGTVHPNWWPQGAIQMIGTANLWAINATGTRFSYQTAFDGGSTLQPTGYRLANNGATAFAVGSYLRALAVI